MLAKIYCGKRAGPVALVWRTDRSGSCKLDPVRSLRLVNHSPNGFEWGYSGAGPAQLALAILLDYFKPDVALHAYQDFKSIVALMPDDEWELSGTEIAFWMKNHLAKRPLEAAAYFVAKWDGAKQRIQ